MHGHGYGSCMVQYAIVAHIILGASIIEAAAWFMLGLYHVLEASLMVVFACRLHQCVMQSAYYGAP